MPKSKYQLKAEKSVTQVRANKSKGKGKGKTYRPKYYDEGMVSETKSSSGAIMAIGLISLLIIGGGITGILLTRDPGGNGTTTTTTTTTTDTSGIFIEPGDTINLLYTLWAAPPQSGLSGEVDMSAPLPQQEPLMQTTVTKEYLINGFYYELLGMVYMEEKTFSIAASRDEDFDGLDDYTGQEPLGYYWAGNATVPMNALYDTNLVFYVQITYIAKA
ncbi:MAG: hypothetical protein ACTSWW_09250 [Promethearchaeota archaeon]